MSWGKKSDESRRILLLSMRNPLKHLKHYVIWTLSEFAKEIKKELKLNGFRDS